MFGIYDLHTDVDACGCPQGLYRHTKRVCTESWLLEKKPLPKQGIKPASVLCLAFQSDALPTHLAHPFPWKWALTLSNHEGVCTATESWFWEEKPLVNQGIKPASVLCLAFQADALPTYLWPTNFHGNEPLPSWTMKESALKVDSGTWEKKPLVNKGIKPASVLRLAFQSDALLSSLPISMELSPYPLQRPPLF